MSSAPRAAAHASPLADLSEPFFGYGLGIGIRLPGATGLFTTRRGGVSRGPFATLNLGLAGAQGSVGDDPTAVAENRRRLADQVGTPWEKIARRRQVHGGAVHVIGEPLRGASAMSTGGVPGATVGLPPGDGLVTERAGQPLLVLVADCLPIVLSCGRVVSVLHAGWRGLADGIVAEGVRAIRSLAPLGPITAGIGPGVGGCCYEVAAPVREALGAPDDLGGRVDLKRVAAQRLGSAGVVEIHDVGICTMCGDPALFFSHRRDGGLTGRQAGVVWRS